MRVGAFPFAAGSGDSALLVALAPTGVQANDHQVANDYYAACAKLEGWS